MEEEDGEVSSAQKQPLSEINQLRYDHGLFLVNFVAMLDRYPEGVNRQMREDMRQIQNTVKKPRLESRTFKAHTMDNVMVRRMCDELLSLESPSWKVYDDGVVMPKDKSNWFRTLRATRGNLIHAIRLMNNPQVKIGGYFIMSQMLNFVQSLLSLDLSNSNLNAADARVLSFGLMKNKSLQELRLNQNCISSDGATSLAHVLRVNKELLILDLRSNKIRGLGFCVLADALSKNVTITDLDLRWNFSGEKTDYVEQALIDLRSFCFRNLRLALRCYCNDQLENSIFGRTPSVLEKLRAIREGPNYNASKEHKEVEEEANDETDQKVSGMKICITIHEAKNLPQVLSNAGTDGEHMGMPQVSCQEGECVVYWYLIH